MYQVNDQVLYGGHGVCTITGIESMRFGKTREKFYCLQPLDQPGSRFYVPVENETAVARMSRLLTKESLLELLHGDAIRANNWIADESQRKNRYRELIGSGDRAALLNMIYCLHQHREAQRQAGKKFHQCDENFLHDAQKLLGSEFCAVFGIEQGQIAEFILHEINTAAQNS